MTGPRSDYSWIHRQIELVGIGVMFAFSGGLALRLWINLRGSAARCVVLAAAVAGYVLADFISGFVHWLADRFGSPETPVIGAAFVRPFREHHVDPEAITRHDFVETNGNNCLILVPQLVGTFFIIDAAPGQFLRIFVLGFVLFLSCSILATNQFHKWAHMAEPPVLPRILQRIHLILSQSHHQIHHVSPFNTHYCITTGWLNVPLRKLRVFETLEWLFRRRQKIEGA